MSYAYLSSLDGAKIGTCASVFSSRLNFPLALAWSMVCWVHQLPTMYLGSDNL